jgi:hypothetical protein
MKITPFEPFEDPFVVRLPNGLAFTCGRAPQATDRQSAMPC